MSGEVETRSLPHRAFVMCVSLRLDSVPDLYLRREGSFGAKNGGSGPIRRPSGLPAIVLQKSFCTGDQKSCGLQARLSCKDVRDLIASR
jgi:hypothetical protein